MRTYGDMVTGGGFYDNAASSTATTRTAPGRRGLVVDADEGAFASGHFAASRLPPPGLKLEEKARFDIARAGIPLGVFEALPV